MGGAARARAWVGGREVRVGVRIGLCCIERRGERGRIITQTRPKQTSAHKSPPSSIFATPAYAVRPQYTAP